MRPLPVLLVPLLLAAAAAAAPPSLELRYTMSFGGIHIAEMTDRLIFAEDGYLIDSRAVPEGLAEMLSQPEVTRLSEGGYVEDGQLLMSSYDEARGERTRRIRIDPAAGVIDWEDSKRGGDSAAYEGQLVADPLTLVYSPYAAGKIVDLATWFADGRKLIEFETVTADEPALITTGRGPVEASKIELITGDDDRRREVWFAEELDYLPVKIRIINGSSVVEFLLQSVTEIEGAGSG